MQLESGKFSGHQSFTLRNTWLTKGVTECARNPHVFRDDDSLLVLGVGKNMVEAIRYWGLASQVVREKPEERGACAPTDLGKRLFLGDSAWDPYLEDVASLWLIHWLVATNWAYATTIYYAFSELTGTFTRHGLEASIAELAGGLGARATDNSIRRDVSVFIRTYVGGSERASASVEDLLDGPLAELGLLYEVQGEQTYAFSRGPKDSLPDAVFLYALCDYAEQQQGQRSFTFDELAYGAMAPGRVFKLDELALAERLERMEGLTAGAIQFTETAGYRQVITGREVDKYAALDDYYGREARGGDDGRV